MDQHQRPRLPFQRLTPAQERNAKFHKAHEHVHSCAKTNELGIQQIHLDAICPLGRPCSYQKCGHGAQHLQFVPCAATFETNKQMREHYRTHVRTMTKTLPDRTKELSCFFGSCASNPEGGRLNRGGPTFSTEEDRLAHMWEVHQVYAKWTANVELCNYCHTWLSEPYEWRKHAPTHITEAATIIEQHGYSGVTTGRTLMPRICPFCYHDETKPAHQRVYCHERQGYPKHIGVHFVDMDRTKKTRRCPCFPTFCSSQNEMDNSEIAASFEACSSYRS
ncbi:hypothetical protein B0H65DRAFT_189507 [Neurospora tetraspora]|uniref:Uncharacterized protein n=1 Tax=Neurospora tetraspora TaxID=94610 RepID=A0AAE0JF92_9PEZI|nr:hypothetical protein B0H65DRAFT_189507 [Neurospora tetraspora]